MTDLDRWIAANDRFLGASLAWLRQRLEALAHASSAPARPPDYPAANGMTGATGATSASGTRGATARGSASAAYAANARGVSAEDAGMHPADAPVAQPGPVAPPVRPRSLLTRVWSAWDADDAPAASPLGPASSAPFHGSGPAVSGGRSVGDRPALPPAEPVIASPTDPAAARPTPPPTSAQTSAPPSASTSAQTSAPTPPAGGASPLQLLDPASPDPPPALSLLARRLGLTPFESHVMLLCAAMELDTRVGALCARAQQDPSRPYPTFALALTLFDAPAWDVLSPERPLRYWRLIEINQPGAQPLVTSALKADERIVNYLKGLNYLDDRLAPLVAPVPRELAPLPSSQQETSDAIAEHLGRARESAHPPLLQLLGTDSQSKLLVAEQAASRLGLMLHRIAAEALPTQGPDLETFARLWQRESALLPLALYVDAADVDRASGPAAAAVQRLCRRGVGIVMLDTRQPWPDLGRGALSFDVAKPTPTEQFDAWRMALGDAPDAAEAARRLAGQFNFNLPSIQTIAATARARVGADTTPLTPALSPLRGARGIADEFLASEGGERRVRRLPGTAPTTLAPSPLRGARGSADESLAPEGGEGRVRGLTGAAAGLNATSGAAAAETSRLGEAVWRDSLRHARPALDQLAQPLDAKATWDALELPDTEKRLLRQIADQVGQRLAVYDTWGFRDRMNRGLGISVLFAGESGTGKTMAAEVLANDLSLMLYRIDLSSVVSKYIGETERNLRKLFDAAEDGGAMLFFDEADALFGKRSEVKDSHDRYANIEINYLLQRMETYRGLAVLATNMKSALDNAFMRRLRFIVNFPFPGHAERLAIWRKAFPPRAPLAALDYGRLARFNLTGGSIHNIALNAAFLAAHAGEPISMRLVLDSVRNEYRKLEKPVNEADFRWLEPASSNAASAAGTPGAAGAQTAAGAAARTADARTPEARTPEARASRARP